LALYCCRCQAELTQYDLRKLKRAHAAAGSVCYLKQQ
jgi:hypothetical protein